MIDQYIPALAGFVHRAGIPVSDIESDTGDEVAVALGHHADSDVRAAFHEHAHFMWGQRYGNGTIRRAWAVNVGSLSDWELNPAAEDDPGAFPVTYWDPYWERREEAVS